MSYARHEHLVAPGRAKPQLWRLFLGCLLAVAGQFLAVAAIIACISTLSQPVERMARLTELMSPTTPLATLLVLGSFLGLVAGTWIAARALQKRSLGSLIGHPATVLRHFVTSAVTIFLLFGLLLLVWPMETRSGLSLTLWLTLLPVSLLAVLVQTGAEELAFRGYLQSQLAARFSSRIVWLLGPAVLFGALHFAPQVQGETAALVALAATLFGYLAGDLTARTGSLGAAWGFHFANNTLAILVIATPGALSGLSLRLQLTDITTPPDLWTMIGELLLVLVGWLVLRRVLAV